MHTLDTLGKHIARIKWYSINKFLAIVLFGAIMLKVPNLLTSIAKPTIALHKARLWSSKGRLAFLGSIAQSLFVKRESLATQAF
jgi:hypothetical protein